MNEKKERDEVTYKYVHGDKEVCFYPQCVKTMLL